MSSKPRDVLIEIVAKYGDPILTTPTRCEGLLKDYSGEDRREISALMTCLRSGVVEQLCELNETSIKAACPGLALKLGQNSTISSALAIWTVESWAIAIGLLDPIEAKAPLPNLDGTSSQPAAATEEQATTSIELVESQPTQFPKLEASSQTDSSAEKVEAKDFLAQVFVPRWPMPDWSLPERQVVVYPDSSGQKPNLREAVRDAVENTCLLLKPGRYKESLAIKRNLQIRADGEPGEVILEAISSSAVILDGACLFISGVTLKSVAGKDRKAAAAVEVKSGHLAMEYCDLTSDSSTIMEVKGAKSEVILRDCHLHDGKAGGIVFQDSAMGYLEGCHFYQNKLSNVVIGKGCAPTLFSCKISNALMAGFYVNDGGGGLIENCDIWGNSVAGIQCQRKGNPRVRHCRISLNQRYGVLVAEHGEGSFEHCQIFDNARAGVTINQQSRPSFSRCQIFDNHGEGVEISDQSTGEFLDCEIFNNENSNVGMKDKSATLFRRCQVHDGHQEGIRLTAGAEGLFHQCTIYSNSKPGMVVTQAKPVIQGCKFYSGMENGGKC